MILSARILEDVGSVNNYRVSAVKEFTEGDAFDVYFQLVDATQDRDNTPPGRRYMPPATSVLTATVDNIDDAKQVARSCTQPYPTQDPSIWKLAMLATDVVRGTSNLKLTLTEPGSVVKRGLVKNVVRAYPNSNV